MDSIVPCIRNIDSAIGAHCHPVRVAEEPAFVSVLAPLGCVFRRLLGEAARRYNMGQTEKRTANEVWMGASDHS